MPGASLAVVQGGKVVFSGGFGVKELGKPEKPDGDTLYMIASNTKAMTTMLLGRLVDQKKITWQTPVSKLLPQFKLGDADTTRQVLVEHLICACTGLVFGPELSMGRSTLPVMEAERLRTYADRV